MVDLVQHRTLLLVDTRYDGFDAEHSLKRLLGVDLIVVSEARSQEINWNVVAKLVLEVGSFVAQPGNDVTSIGWVTSIGTGESGSKASDTLTDVEYVGNGVGVNEAITNTLLGQQHHGVLSSDTNGGQTAGLNGLEGVL